MSLVLRLHRVEARIWAVLGPVLGLVLASGTAFAGHADAPISGALTSFADARVLAQEVIQRARLSGDMAGSVLQVIHIQGRSMSPYLKAALVEVHNAGIQIDGTVISPEGFEIEQNYLLNVAPDDGELGRMALSLPPQERQKFRAWFSPRNIKRKLGELRNRLFGTPEGITVLQHFVTRREDGAWERTNTTRAESFESPELRESAVKDEKRIRWLTVEAMGMGAAGLVTSLLVKGAGLDSLVVPLIVQSAWIGTLTYFSRELSAFKTQGSDLVVFPDAPEGEQIQVRPNRPFYYFSSIVQSLIVNGLMISVIFSSSELTTAVLTTAVTNALFSVYAKAPADYAISRLYVHARKARERGEQEEYERASKKATVLNRVWNVVYSVLKSMHLLGPKEGSAADTGLLAKIAGYSTYALPVFGTVGMLMDIKKSLPALQARFREWSQPQACSALLVLKKTQ